jgi:hypothetical protein
MLRGRTWMRRKSIGGKNLITSLPIWTVNFKASMPNLECTFSNRIYCLVSYSSGIDPKISNLYWILAVHKKLLTLVTISSPLLLRTGFTCLHVWCLY